MKKSIIAIISLFSLTIINAENYVISINDNNYKGSVQISNYTKTGETNNPTYPEVIMGESSLYEVSATVTLDRNTGLEWLDLTETIGKSINQVNSELSTTYIGWRLPTRAEIITMTNNAFPNETLPFGGYLTGRSPTTNGAIFSQMFGTTTAGNSTYGLYNYAGATKLFGIDGNGINIYTDYSQSINLNGSRSSDGVFLVR